MPHRRTREGVTEVLEDDDSDTDSEGAGNEEDEYFMDDDVV